MLIHSAAAPDPNESKRLQLIGTLVGQDISVSPFVTIEMITNLRLSRAAACLCLAAMADAARHSTRSFNRVGKKSGRRCGTIPP